MWCADQSKSSLSLLLRFSETGRPSSCPSGCHRGRAYFIFCSIFIFSSVFIFSSFFILSSLILDVPFLFFASSFIIPGRS